MSLLDWLNDTGIFGGPTGGTPMQPGPGAMTGEVNPMGDPTGVMLPMPTPAPAATRGMPPVQMTGADAPNLADPSTNDIAAGMQGGSMPTPPYPPGGDPMIGGTYPPGGDPMIGGTYPPAGDPMTAGDGPPQKPVPPGMMPGSKESPRPGPPMPLGPGLGVAAPKTDIQNAPGQTWLGRAFGITPDQAGLRGREVTSGLAAGLKAIGQGAGVGQGKFAAFAGGMGNAMEGSQKEKGRQDKQMTDYLNSAIKAKQAGDEAGYKRNYLLYLKAKLTADTERMASKDAVANKNDTPTQLYLNAERLVQADPEVRDASKALAEARKNGSPEEATKAQTNLQKIIAAKQAQHYGALGLNPQTAAQIAQQPGNNRENPVDAGKLGITKDNIHQKLQPGQYFRNPSDGQVYQYKGQPKGEGKKKGAMPDKPTNPEPVNPMKPYKTPAEGDGGSGDGED